LGYGEYIKNNKIYKESNIFVIDSYKNFYDNYDSYMTKLSYDEIMERFREIILKNIPVIKYVFLIKILTKYL
jgi:hypothetical protein